MLKLVQNFAMPGAAIVFAALIQVALTALWPGIKQVPSGVVTIDTYIVVLLTIGFCFAAGAWAKRNAPTIAGALCTAAAPLGWAALFLSPMMGVGRVAWLRPIVIFAIFTALAPLLGVAVGWAMSSSNLQRRQQTI